MYEFMNMTKALSDRNRVRIVMALNGGELCVCQLVALLGLAPSTVSKHISLLRNARLVESRKEGLLVFYSLPEKADKKIESLLNWVRAVLFDEDQIKKDLIYLKEIKNMNIEDICRKQNRRNCCKGKH